MKYNVFVGYALQVCAATVQERSNVKKAVLMKTTMTKSSTFYKDMFRLALPIVCQNLITTAVGSADVIMLGWVSQTALSAGSLASQIMFILNLVYSGISSVPCRSPAPASL